MNDTKHASKQYLQRTFMHIWNKLCAYAAVSTCICPRIHSTNLVEWHQVVADSAYLFVRQSQHAWQCPLSHPVFLLIYSTASKHQIHFDTWLCASSSALQDLQHTNASSTSSMQPGVMPLRCCNTILLRTLRTLLPSNLLRRGIKKALISLTSTKSILQ